MGRMTPADYDELVRLLDGRIDELTKPIPSKQIRRFAEAIRSATLGDDDSVGTYSEEDYDNLLIAQEIINEQLPPILENVRAYSIEPRKGWHFEPVTDCDSDNNLCAICCKPFQHFEFTVKVHHLDHHANAYRGVCRECVRSYAPLEFVEQPGVEAWLRQNPDICSRVEDDNKAEELRVDFIDACRTHSHQTHYSFRISDEASRWVKGLRTEWR